jgi:hypothetical protein
LGNPEMLYRRIEIRPALQTISSLPVRTVNFVIRFTKFMSALLTLKLIDVFVRTPIDR